MYNIQILYPGQLRGREKMSWYIMHFDVRYNIIILL